MNFQENLGGASQVNSENDSTISIGDILFLLKKHIVMIIIVTIALTICGYILAKFIIPPTYESDAMMVVTAGQTAQSNVITYDQLNTAQQLVNTCAVVLKSETVMDQVIQELGLKTTSRLLANKITVSGVNQTEVIDIVVKYSDPKTAAVIANDISKIAPDILVKTVKASSVEIVSQAKENNTPVSPKIPLITLVALFIGFILSSAIAVITEMMDNTFTTEEDIKNILGITVLGVIPSANVKD